ncbi:MAG TPA: AGE family epimerase/isomerase [Acidimicrobiales bacterium]|nr:AGE family epimerase/isomerase [Acidimicrobiales bacterium]
MPVSSGPDGEALHWLGSSSHRAALGDEARRLLRFFRATVAPDGCFVELDDDGRPMPTGCPPATSPRQQLLTVARAVHSYAIGELLGVPGCGSIVERGLAEIVERHRDDRAGGYFASVTSSGPLLDTKSAYDHAFVLLAASSATSAGHDAAGPLFEDVLGVIDEHFWSERDGATAETFSRSWEETEPYRGANSNMHLCESFLAAGALTGDAALGHRSVRIAQRLIDGYARSNGWLLPEHYDRDWQALFEYNADKPDDPFRPYGATIGHLVEWSRLLIGAWLLEGARDAWLPDAARALFARAVASGWDAVNGGLVYTVGWDGAPVNDDHYWWPVAEGIGTSSYLARVTGDASYEAWYRRFWDFAAAHLVDHDRAGWYAQLDRENRRKVHPWYGKPDLYHVLQACVLPAYRLAPSVAAAVIAGEDHGTGEST